MSTMATVATVAIINHKGGVGKTTSAVNLGVGLGRLGRRVLLVDVDPQAHLTASLGLTPEDDGAPTLAGLLAGEAALDACVVETEGVRVLPGDPDMALHDSHGGDGADGLGRALAQARNYDVILLDCPPNLGLLTIAALTAATHALVPVQPEYLALQSIAKLGETLDQVRAGRNPGLAQPLFLPVRFNRRKTLNREVVSTLSRHFPGQTLSARIRDAVALAEAPGFGQSIFAYRPRSPGAEDYLAASKELASRITGRFS